MAAVKGEQLKKSTTTKDVFHYVDSDNKINQLSREVYKKEDTEIHYPRGFTGGQKYDTIEKIIYKGFKKKLPVGIIKAVTYGYGFTKTLNPIAYWLGEKFQIKTIIIEKNGKTALDKKSFTLHLNEQNLKDLQGSMSSVFQRNRAELNLAVQISLNLLFPTVVAKPPKTYSSNSLALSLSSWGNDITEFSDKDKNAIKELFEKLSLKTDFLTKDALAKTKEVIDNKYIADTLTKFNTFITTKTHTPTLEKKWQTFLKANNWIFSSIFAQPIVLFQDEAFVGGRALDNKNGKLNDFFIKNDLSNNVSFLEIKTHLTALVESKAYRGTDVFSATKDLSGAVVQVLNQRDNFQKEYYALKAKSAHLGALETFNSKSVVMIGSLNSLSAGQKSAFELFRSNSKDVEIITFDELQSKIQSLQSLISPKAKKATPKKKAAKKK
ncbi:MAG: DUF4263 domain-containing protein [Sphingobacteriales bacterium]|nr:DUF4263 domain-containing protein [Sphingobacteriales bacterium]OJV98378.1 MAG: hypothetical protein BGO52_11360 [Sphingobacteriales bacterium 44-61]